MYCGCEWNLVDLQLAGNRARLLAAFVGSNPTIRTIFNYTQKEARMKKALVVLLMLVGSAHASERFSTNSNFVTTSTINWVAVDNVFEACDIESKKRGNGGFARLGKGLKMDGCAFWTDPTPNKTNTCTIITAKNTDHDTVGHEFRHCYQGNFHK